MEGVRFFVMLGALVSWPLATNADWRSFLFLVGESDSAPGRVTGADLLGYQEGDRDVYRSPFEFTRSEQSEAGASYFVGAAPRVGEEVTIEWPSSWPAITRIRGGRTAPLHRGALFVLIFPVVALLMARAMWNQAGMFLEGLRIGVPSRKGEPSGLVDPETRELLAKAGDLPRGLELDEEGGFRLALPLRLVRPGIILVLAAGSLFLLIRGFVR